MDDLVEWLRGQLDEDERLALAAMRENPLGLVLCLHLPPEVQQHNARHDPARVLREVEATRRLIRRYELACSASTSPVSFTRGQDDGYRQGCLDALRDRAEASYSDCPGYREEWRP